MSACIRHLNPGDFATAWAAELSDWVRMRIERRTLAYIDLSQEEHDDAVLRAIKSLEHPLERAGQHRLPAWEAGWHENLVEFEATGSPEALAPRYFGKNPLVRWRQRYVRGLESSLEYEMFGVLLDWVLDDWLVDPATVYEFGCGTGHNLIRARERFPDAQLVGFDWAKSSMDLVSRLSEATGDARISSGHFDYFRPDVTTVLERGSSVLTVASLEQMGSDFEAFIDYLMGQPVACVIHLEPIGELLNPDNLLDYLSLRYFRQRNYLNGLLEYLERKQAEGRVEILRAQRSYVGSFHIDGYSIVKWRPRSA